MKIKRLGNTGLQVSEVALGTMTFGHQANQEVAFQMMDIAERAGVNFFDTANIYPDTEAGLQGRTEEIVGNWLRVRKARERVVLATKCGGPMGEGPNQAGLSRKHILAACEASLRRLQTDYLDLYQVHWPDPQTPVEETLSALDQLVREGKVRYIGCSNFPAWQLADALWTSKMHGWAGFVSDQPRYNVLFRMIEDEILPLCRAHGLGVIVYNPLAAGVLTGRYRQTQEVQQGTRFSLRGSGQLYQRRYWKEAMFEAVEQLHKFFTPRNKSLTHVALAWVLQQPGITSAILGASRPEQLTDSLKGVELTLDEEELTVSNEAWFQLPREQDQGVARR